MALMFWFGGWLLSESDEYTFRDFLISMMALFFSIYGLTVAFEGATDRNKAKLAAQRIFDLTDRMSSIDPLKEGGERPDLSKPMQRKSSKKAGKHHDNKKSSSKKLLKHSPEDYDGDGDGDGVVEKPASKKKKHDHGHDVDDPEKPSSDKKHKRKSSKKVVNEESHTEEKPSSGKEHKKKKSTSKKHVVDNHDGEVGHDDKK
jgi:hypothetical protein